MTKIKKLSLNAMAANAKIAAEKIANASTEQRQLALHYIIQNLKNNEREILVANQADIIAAQADGLDAVLIDRLSLQGRLADIISDVQKVIELEDVVGEFFEEQTLPNNLKVVKCRTPIGVLGVIYESRPNVTIDISVLSIKSGNCAILRGGKETIKTNQVLVKLIQDSLLAAHLPIDSIQLITSTDRNEVKKLLRLHHYIDLIIPRGGANLHQFCRENSCIPVITGGIGICHLFIDETADLEKSVRVILNAKTQRPTVCNALDTVLVHEKIAHNMIPKIISLLQKQGVSFKLDPIALKLAKGFDLSTSTLAQPEDWDREWLSLVLGMKVVVSMQEAIDHIKQHSTGHSDGILTENNKNAEHFVRVIDSAAVYINASTRFTDGSQLGLGAEVAISTQKLHARGPMGLRELTSYKWIIKGNYAVRVKS